ncbi:MAG: hypothetical protein PHU25_20460 [Deltaproteobacteria bacterium]|nr:hypothetical protein [Deltaproteobacteria bacterium]
MTDQQSWETQVFKYPDLFHTNEAAGFTGPGAIDPDGDLIKTSFTTDNILHQENGAPVSILTMHRFHADGGQDTLLEEQYPADVDAGIAVVIDHSQTFLDGDEVEHVAISHMACPSGRMVFAKMTSSGSVVTEPSFGACPPLPKETASWKEVGLTSYSEDAIVRIDDTFVAITQVYYQNKEWASLPAEQPTEFLYQAWSFVLDREGQPVAAPTLIAQSNERNVYDRYTSGYNTGLAWNGKVLGWCRNNWATRSVVFQGLDRLGRSIGDPQVLLEYDGDQIGVSCDTIALEDNVFLSAFNIFYYDHQDTQLWVAYARVEDVR